jgi:transcriptional regulator with XRE-family HTH domain
VEIWPISATFDAESLLRWQAMDTNEALRQQALRLVKLGVSQKIVAAKMGMAPSTFSKWLNRKSGIGPASVVALDRFNRYLQELSSALDSTVLQADVSSSHTATPVMAGTPEKQVGMNGRPLATSSATPLPPHGQAAPVSGAPRQTYGQTRTGIEHLIRDGEAAEAQILEEQARPTPIHRKHVAAPPSKTAHRRARARKHHR